MSKKKEMAKFNAVYGKTVEECYDEIAKIYKSNDVELYQLLNTISCPYITLNDIVKLVALLRRDIDKDVMIRIVEGEFENLATGKFMDKNIII